MKFLGRDPPESSLPASDRAPSEGEGETGCAGRTFSIFPEHYRTKHRVRHGFVRLAQVLLIILINGGCILFRFSRCHIPEPIRNNLKRQYSYRTN